MGALVFYVRLHDGRYHGEGDWPPSPARLFQALVAGAGLSGPIGHAEQEALEWLEAQEPPLVAAPFAWQRRRGVLFYMPNNDSDAIAGDPLRMSKIRTATKTFRPWLFDAAIAFLYAWPCDEGSQDEARARTLCALAERLYQLGRGIDMAWAWGEIIGDGELDARLAGYQGRIHRPSAGKGSMILSSPCRGSFESLKERHRAFGERFRYWKERKAVKVVFRKPPRPRFQLISYDSPPSRQLYELRHPIEEGAFAAWPLRRPTALVVQLRDAALVHLSKALPASAANIERVLVGRRRDGTNDCPPDSRVRIVPLPSIGHVHADRDIRRVLVEVPATCPVRADDVHWAFSGIDVVDVETGEAVLTRTDDDTFLRHYGLPGDTRHAVWRTVTPAALPQVARRRRIDPALRREDAKGGYERATEQARAAAAIHQALRHAGIRTPVVAVRVQREPFEGNGARVEAFAEGTRFTPHRLWHVEVTFEVPVPGPLVIGDGRFLGLGLMAPVEQVPGVHVFGIVSTTVDSPNPGQLARALRRAVMARVQAVLDAGPLPVFFSGHERDGRAARGDRSSDVAFTCDLHRSRLLVLAPHVLDGRPSTPRERQLLTMLDDALAGFSELRAGAAGLLRLERRELNVAVDPLFGPSRTWESLTPYQVTRHLSEGSAASAVVRDVQLELARRGLPQAGATVTRVRAAAGRGLEGWLRLEFATAVRGPLLLGRSRYLGGGLFARSARVS